MLKANPEKPLGGEKLIPENELLLLLIKPDIDIEEVKKILDQGVNWEDFQKKVWNHRVAPLVFYNLQKCNLLTQVPETVSKTLNHSYLYTLKNNMSYFAELSKILKMFEEKEIDVIVLKGAAFAEVLYENIGLRYFSDIDLLFKKKDMGKVQEIFFSRGYRPYEAYRPKRYYQDYHFHLPFTKKSGTMEFHFEAHWHLIAPSWPVRINIEEFWGNAIPLTINGFNVKSLSWNHNLLYLSWHNAIDSFRELLGLCDISRILTRFQNQVSYDFLLAEAVKANLKIPVYYSFSLTRKLLGMPKEVNFKKIEPKKKEARFFNFLLTKEHFLEQYLKSDWIIGALEKIYLFEGFRYRMELLKNYLFPREEDLDKLYFENPETLTFLKRVGFFFKGVKVLFHMLWFRISPRTLQKFLNLKY